MQPVYLEAKQPVAHRESLLLAQPVAILLQVRALQQQVPVPVPVLALGHGG